MQTRCLWSLHMNFVSAKWQRNTILVCDVVLMALTSTVLPSTEHVAVFFFLFVTCPRSFRTICHVNLFVNNNNNNNNKECTKYKIYKKYTSYTHSQKIQCQSLELIKGINRGEFVITNFLCEWKHKNTQERTRLHKILHSGICKNQY